MPSRLSESPVRVVYPSRVQRRRCLHITAMHAHVAAARSADRRQKQKITLSALSLEEPLASRGRHRRAPRREAPQAAGTRARACVESGVFPAAAPWRARSGRHQAGTWPCRRSFAAPLRAMLHLLHGVSALPRVALSLSGEGLGKQASQTRQASQPSKQDRVAAGNCRVKGYKGHETLSGQRGTRSLFSPRLGMPNKSNKPTSGSVPPMLPCSRVLVTPPATRPAHSRGPRGLLAASTGGASLAPWPCAT